MFRARDALRVLEGHRLTIQLPSTKVFCDFSIFDYGAGNLRSVENTLGAIGAEYELVRDADGLRGRRR